MVVYSLLCSFVAYHKVIRTIILYHLHSGKPDYSWGGGRRFSCKMFAWELAGQKVCSKKYFETNYGHVTALISFIILKTNDPEVKLIYPVYVPSALSPVHEPSVRPLDDKINYCCPE